MHHTKKRHHRKRSSSVGALNPKSLPVRGLAVAVGYFFADQINPLIDKMLPVPVPGAAASTFSLTPTSALVYGGEIGIGGALMFMKGKPSLIKTGIGGLLLGAGLERALKATGVVKGYQAVPVIGRHRMAGYQSTPVINGNGTPAQLAGTPSQLQGFRVNGYGAQGSGVLGSVMSGLYEGAGVNGSASGSGITSTSGSNCMN